MRMVSMTNLLVVSMMAGAAHGARITVESGGSIVLEGSAGGGAGGSSGGGEFVPKADFDALQDKLNIVVRVLEENGMPTGIAMPPSAPPPPLSPVSCGTSQDDAALSCQSIKAGGCPGAESGSYWIDVNRDGDVSDAVQMFCEMEMHGGGWTMFATIGSSTDFSFVSNTFCGTGQVGSPITSRNTATSTTGFRLSDADINLLLQGRGKIWVEQCYGCATEHDTVFRFGGDWPGTHRDTVNNPDASSFQSTGDASRICHHDPDLAMDSLSWIEAEYWSDYKGLNTYLYNGASQCATYMAWCYLSNSASYGIGKGWNVFVREEPAEETDAEA